MNIKYNRTSTIQQEGERFKQDQANYDLVLFDKGTSGKIEFRHRGEAQKLIKLVEAGKVSSITVEELSRLGRNTIDVLQTLKYFEAKQINVIVRNLGNFQSVIDGKKNPMFDLITGVMSSIYELERDNIKERTEAGKKQYVQNGGKLGRKYGTTEGRTKFMEKESTKKIISLLQKGKTVRDIAGRLEVSTTTVTKVRKYIEYL